MELTGKAEADFLRFLRKHKSFHFNKYTKKIIFSNREFFESPELFKNSLIIEWFDSVGVYIDIEFFRKNIKEEAQFVSSTTDERNGLQSLGVQYNSRQEAIEQAIIKANQIYNERK